MRLTDLLMDENVFPVLVIGGAYFMSTLPYFYARYGPNATSSFYLVNSNDLDRINTKRKIASVMHDIIHPIETYAKLRGKPSAKNNNYPGIQKK